MVAPHDTVQHARKLRRRLTLPEVLVWQALRGGRLVGRRFRRQHPVGPYILDFYCDELQLAVEIDGHSHDHPDRIAHDQRRTGWLNRQGVQMIRLAARDVLADMDGALGIIRRTVGR
ncbi:MAG: endonuclease domain-containing protein [Brevundimonas sp.]|nr:endonuclease domain-containing protein [Brevundimonas sp.]MDP1914233.1 endonuclease domain-containing protein [Brevundimonas sp.]